MRVTGKSFTVTQPRILIWLSLLLMGFFVLVLTVDALAAGMLETAKLIAVTVLILIPCGLILLWALSFRIRVEGTTVRVRRFFGFANYRFDVKDITLVVCKTVQNHMGQNQKLTLYTAAGKKVPVETLMDNSGLMIRFLEENVSPDKFRRSTKEITKGSPKNE